MSPGVNIDMVVCRGGLDQITPTLSLANGFVRNALNFECAVTGGYSRIAGYERFDGRPAPSESASTPVYVGVMSADYNTIPVVGNSITSSSGGAGSIVYVEDPVYFTTPPGGSPPVHSVTADYFILVISGTFLVGDTLTSAGQTYIVESLVYATTPLLVALIKNGVSDYYRSSITAALGSGPILGVVELRDIVYVFQNDALSTACNIYKSGVGGWRSVGLYKTVSFTAGQTEPADGEYLKQGSVYALIKRVVRTSGSWQAGDATGQLIIAAPVGGTTHFIAAAGTVGPTADAVPGTTTLTLSGAETAITLLPGGRFEFEERNFAGQAATNRIYGCDGVNKAFEFDGDVLVPITTGATVDTPTHIATHKGYLFLAQGSSVMHSAPGLPYDWTALSGAGELATGDTVTGMISMPGGTNQATLGVFNRSNTLILYGSSPADWNMVSYNTGSGAIPYSLQNMAQTFAFDDRGVNSIQTALQYGNFAQSALSNAVLPFINSRINMMTATTLCRRKSQYRIFFSDGFALFITVVNGKLLGCMPVYFPNPVSCCYEGKKADGTDVMYFGSTNGYVYQMEKGTSFDGAAIDYNLTMNYSNSKSPRTLKRYRKCTPEITADAGTYAAFNFGYMLGYDSAEYSQASEDSYSKYAGTSRWDAFTWDNFFWDTKPQDIIECYMEGTAENVAILIDGSSDYVPPFTINSFLIHYSMRRLMR